MSTVAFLLIFLALGVAGWGMGLPTSYVVGAVLGATSCMGLVMLRSLARGLLASSRRSSAAPLPRWWTVPLRGLPGTVESLRLRAEEGSFERVQGRLRWLGLTELWSSVHRSPIPAHFDGRVLRLVRAESGFERCAILHLNPRSGELSGSWQVEAEAAPRLEPVRWSLTAISGAVADCLRATRPAHSDEAPQRELLAVRGQRPPGLGRGESHVVLPLLSQVAPPDCLVSGWLHRPNCKAYFPHSAPTPHLDGDRGLRQCLSCRHYPVLGVLVFLRQPGGDLARESHRLAPLATMVSAMLEHRRLYQRTVAEGRLRESMLDAMWNGLVGTDSRGQIQFSNRRAREMARAEAWEGRHLGDFLELPERDALGRALVEGIPYAHADAVLVRADLPANAAAGERRLPIRVALNPLAPEAGARPGVVCVFEDRTQVQALESEVRHLDTLAAMGRFASALAHEIRNPLAGIQAGISYLRRSVCDSEEEGQTLDIMEGEIQRLDGILRSLLSVARPRELQAGPCELKSLCQRVATSLQGAAFERSVRFRVEGPETEVLADEAMLHQVLLNLMKNAAEASPPRGLVRVFVEETATEGSGSEARGLQVRIEDSGPGLDPDLIPRLFEPFVSQKAQGTGLGLYVCHHFVERHGGRLSAENIADGGARFTLELPAVPALIGG